MNGEKISMKAFRTYGHAPFSVAVIHGGPGAPGEMAPVARERSRRRGVLEPLQSAATVDGQVQELAETLASHGTPPVTLIGWSWGAMLSFILTARHPHLVKKLILLSSGPFLEHYALTMEKTRMARLDEAGRREWAALPGSLADAGPQERDRIFTRLGELSARTDSFDPMDAGSDVLECQFEIHRSVWNEAREMRARGELIALGKEIRCPVSAIHGDHDPHPFEGVREPLEAVLTDFRFLLLKECGHTPWIERRARDRFYALLEEEIGDS